MKSKYTYGIFLIVISALYAILLESTSSGYLLFTKGILAEQLRSDIISHSTGILVTFIVFHCIAFLWFQRSKSKEEAKGVFDNICKAIFVSHVKDHSERDNNQVRVTLFKAFDWYKYTGLLSWPRKTSYLQQVGRYQ